MDVSSVVNPWQAAVLVVLILAVLVGPQLGALITSVQGKRLARRAAEEIEHQSKPNSGQSMKDYLVRIEQDGKATRSIVTDLTTRVERLEQARQPWWRRAR
ncbi:hypothetical protein [Cellulosimicrobium sp. 22601]|uniref:hypothetical protein n=1 Tax=unclassified Cellulosimicrobium TaxID=2624466 RepID=UPI003F879EE8